MKIPRGQFEKLALEQIDMLHRIARRLTRDPSQADDLVQETYLRAFRGQEKFDLQQFGIRPWLVRIMHNLFVSRALHEAHQPAAMDEHKLDQAPAVETKPLASAGFEGMDEHLVNAIRQLPRDYQTVLMLWAIDELSYKEIADAVGVPIGTVMSRLHRARQRLSEQLRDYCSREGIIRE